MVSSVSSAQSVQQTATVQQTAKQNPQPKPSKTELPKDTVELSATARQALAGDVDHDGDSH